MNQNPGLRQRGKHLENFKSHIENDFSIMVFVSDLSMNTNSQKNTI